MESYYRARYYDPSPGRFLSEDPLRFGIGPTVRDHRSRMKYHLMDVSALRGRSSSFYPYVSNRPNNEADPWGLWQVTVGGGDGPGLLVTFGKNYGHWNIGLDVGAAAEGFASLDLDNVDCDCGPNLHAEGDLGAFGIPLISGIGGSLNVDQNGDTSGTISVADPTGLKHLAYTYDPSGAPLPPSPTIGGGEGLFAGGGYNWCF